MNTITQSELRRMVPELADAKPRPDKKDMLKMAWKLVTREPWPFVPEHRFDAVRKWRFDWSYIELKLAIEIEGVVYKEGEKSRHQTAKGLVNDCEKYNAAAQQQWIVLRYVPEMITRDPFAVVEQILEVASMLRMQQQFMNRGVQEFNQ